MPGFLTRETADQILDSLLGGAPPPARPVVYVGLSLARADRCGAVVEPEGNGYARVAVPNDRDHWAPAVLGMKTNAHPIRFPVPAGVWGFLRSAFLADAPTGGAVLAVADLNTPRHPIPGVAPVIAPDALNLSFN